MGAGRRGAPALRGWLFGIGAFGAGLSWIYESFGFSDVPGALALVLTVGFVGCLALYPAVLGWIVVRIAPAGPADPRENGEGCVAAAGGVSGGVDSVGVVAGMAFTGLPWLQVGYAQIDGPASGWLPVIGAHGTGALAALVAGGLAWVLVRRDRHALAVLGAVAALWGAGAMLARVDWVRPAGMPVTVAIVQGNVAQDRKWRPEMRDPTLERYAALTREHFDADLVVWPESAAPGFLDTLEEFTRGMRAEAVERGSAVLTGVPVRDAPGGPYLNGVVMLGPDSGVYYKRRLVPFGEYLPFGLVLRPGLEGAGDPGGRLQPRTSRAGADPARSASARGVDLL